MTRSSAREIAVHLTFALSFDDQEVEELLDFALTRDNFQQLSDEIPLYGEFPNEKQRTYIAALVRGVYDHGAELDGYISKYAIGWSFSRISRMAATVMRVAMYEILYMPFVPTGAAINEAVEICKHYEAPETASFVNGILGTFARGELPPDHMRQPTAPAEDAVE